MLFQCFASQYDFNWIISLQTAISAQSDDEAIWKGSEDEHDACGNHHRFECECQKNVRKVINCYKSDSED